MVTVKKIEDIISYQMILGIIIAAVLVISGGMIFLCEHGTDSFQIDLFKSTSYSTSIPQIIEAAASFSSLGLIELGLLVLILTQVVRVALLVWFYLTLKDYTFTFISLFILTVLLYSIMWKR